MQMSFNVTSLAFISVGKSGKRSESPSKSPANHLSLAKFLIARAEVSSLKGALVLGLLYTVGSGKSLYCRVVAFRVLLDARAANMKENSRGGLSSEESELDALDEFDMGHGGEARRGTAGQT